MICQGGVLQQILLMWQQLRQCRKIEVNLTLKVSHLELELISIILLAQLILKKAQLDYNYAILR